MSKVDVVKLQARKTKAKEYIQYLLTVPRGFIKVLGWSKGDPLIAKVMETTINGRKRKVLVYYKP